MFWRKEATNPEDYPWRRLSLWIEMTEETFMARYHKHQAEVWAARERGSDELDASWTHMVAILGLRARLIAKGWLPPREKDVLERTGPEGGLWLANIPTKWSHERIYERPDLPPEAQHCYPNAPDRTAA